MAGEGLDNAALALARRNTVLNCPGCGTEIAEGEPICPACDYVVDADAFSSEPAEADDDTAAAPGPPSAPASRPSPGKVRPAGARAKAVPGRRRAGKAPAPEQASGSTAIKSIEEIEQARSKRLPAKGGEPRPAKSSSRRLGGMPDAPSRRVAAPPAAPQPDWRVQPSPASSAPPAPRPGASGFSIAAPEELFAEAKRFVVGLPTSDKLAFIGAALTVFFAFFPWKETVVDGEVLGLMSLGFPVFVVSIVGITAIAVRARRFMPKLNPLAPWLVQLTSACFCILWCLIFIKLSWDSRLATSPVGNFEMYISKPSFGVFASLLTSIVSLGGTLMGLKEKPA